jgi:hypothetical protein
MGSAHEHLHLHSEVHWPSHGRVLTHLLESHDQIQTLLCHKSFQGCECSNDVSWLAMIAYLSDILSVCTA